MVSLLKQHFPMIREREEVLEDIKKNPRLKEIFDGWKEEYQEAFLDICSGMRGVKLLYDQFFKAILNPDTSPERLEELISLILKKKVKILKVLPNDSARIAAETSLLIMDIVVELKDGSIADVEVQKLGYAFPGQRSACYSADLLLRQYKRVKGEHKKNFSYRDIKKVFTVIFYEKSTKEFHEFKDIYLHHSEQTTDTGLKIDLLQEYDFIALDIFRKKLYNKGVDRNNRLEAWLTFLCEDDPELMLELIEAYPEFEALYREVYEMCLDMERMMRIFSKELEELDKNTVQYMIDEMQDTIDAQKEQLNQKDEQIRQFTRAFIQDNLDEGVPKERILLKLQNRFDLTAEKAVAYFAEVAES